jgi:hypothetical protein
MEKNRVSLDGNIFIFLPSYGQRTDDKASNLGERLFQGASTTLLGKRATATLRS